MDNKRISEIVEEEMIKQDANRYRDMRKILTIPKSIADELDSVFAGVDATDIGYVLDQTGPYGSRAFDDYYFKNKNIIALYLAGKALGVDLVKVGEG
ncbi:hypothetical protein Tome1A_02265 [Lactococcus lactis subsp. lactis]|uniref:Prophage pi1 protein 21 n=3 Tax=Lactococcus lactis subsp. lactis TaxID=1360 RepID=Q9CIB0_LACLA|nr:hypothetical protein [Lactococcus lactis]NP_076720.1 Orf25 [Lactococcus phage bIL309]MRM77185.1 hypothetical protein [Lactococcus cremoris]AAK04554.1 prophage pi1 protein 21 [Lactococcus lactis subsp. lactis Il1403]AAK08373.1 Orf25 [Lactococcus phage bIL309]ARD95449.1 hypothetical protein LL229_0561 [Lactococcus lactis subsp. lactis]ARE07680.1 hypothetical protein LLUC77_0561 [Lactococcus lactis subsp. lactis]